ncbi:MAG: hypothetical protein QXM75_03370, partial [Candidatus Diapherotrites archaeon]
MIITMLFLVIFSAYRYCYDYDPAQYIAKQTYMLRENESISSIYEIKLEDKIYYVLQISANKQTVGYIVLERYEKRVVSDTIKVKNLVQTAHFLSLYSDFRKKIGDNPNYVWFVSQSQLVQTIIKAMDTEVYELQAIADVIKSSSASEKVSMLSSL